MIRSRCLFALALLPAMPIHAAPVPQFQDGDVVSFIGDSITHSRKFHSYIYLYYLTRFPERHIRFYNAGISGDSAGGALARLDWDILPAKPTVASYMLGMNDVGRGNYGKADPSPDVLAARKRSIDWYTGNLEKLISAVEAATHPKLIVCTPSPYDDTAKLPMENLFGVNDALGLCGRIAGEIAARHGGSVVDFHGPMTALNLEHQKADPTFTLIGADRVHPGDVGQMVMAYLYLKAQGVPALVSRVAIDAAGKATAENAELSGCVAKADGVSFDLLAKSLPFPVEDPAKGALPLVPVEQELDQELLTAELPAGTYRLTIDGQAVGEYPADQLKQGVNLALNPATPQAKQAAELAAINEQRRNLEARLRSVAQVKIMLLHAKVDPEDAAGAQKYFDEFLAKAAATPGGGNGAYFKSQFDNYVKTKPVVPTILDSIEQRTRTLWEKNHPVKHHYELTKLG